MMRNVAKALNKGIAHLLAGGSIQEYMQQAEARELPASAQQELQTLLHTAAAVLPLREMPIPAPRAKAAHRAQFLSEAVRLKEERRAGSARHWLRFPARAWRGVLGTVLTLALVLALGASAANAAAGSLPGSALYPLKLAMEDTRLALTFHTPTRAQLFLRFASERATEMVRLAAAGQPMDERVVQRMAEEWHGAVQAAVSSGKGQGALLLQQVIEASARQKEVLHQASAQAPPEAKPLFATAIVVTEQAAQQAQEALQSLLAPAPTSTPTAAGSHPHSPLPVTPTPTAVETNGHAPLPPTPTGVHGYSPLPATPTETYSYSPLPVTPTETLGYSLPSPTPTETHGYLPPSSTPTPTRGRPSPTPTATPTTMPTSVPTAIPTATPTAEEEATPTPTATPYVAFRLELTDGPDPVPASHRIHYDFFIVNEGNVPMTNVIVVATWSPRDCVYTEPVNMVEKSWTVGTVRPGTRYHIYFTLNTYVICEGTVVTLEMQMTSDQGSAQATTTTTIGPRPTPTPTVTPTPQLLFRVTKTGPSDPVPAGHNIHYDICVVNDGDVPLTNVVLVDRWSPRDCVYLPPDNPAQVTWNLGTVAAHSRRCVHFELSTYSICAGNTVTNEVVMTCDQGTARAERTTTIGPPATATPTPTRTATTVPTATLTFTPLPTDTPTATLTQVPTATPTLEFTLTPTLTLIPRHP